MPKQIKKIHRSHGSQQPLLESQLAGVQYAGIGGISRDCLNAVLRLLQFGDRITKTKILSSSNVHCLLLTIDSEDTIAVKSGFRSGYSGEGPRSFSYVLQVLNAYGVDIEEHLVSADLINRLNESSLTKADLDFIESERPVLGTWHDYILLRDLEPKLQEILWREFPAVIPFAIVDSRIADLAISFWEEADARLMTGYKRLEDIVRMRTRIDDYSCNLFVRAFTTKGGKLTWQGLEAAECIGRMELFAGAFKAYRNPRAHREFKASAEKLLVEFLLLNQLYLLERESVEVV